jgi:hypothetical protein
MSYRLSVSALALPLALCAGCDQARPTVTGPHLAVRAQRSVAEQVIPFQTSSYSFRVVAVVPEPGCNTTGESRRYLSGEGTATHLGSYSVGLSFCARAGGILTDGRGTFVAANGDPLDFTFNGTSAFAPPFTLNFTSYADFTGGSGRFDGATGQAVVTGSLDVRTGGGDGRWEGTISSVGSSER